MNTRIGHDDARLQDRTNANCVPAAGMVSAAHSDAREEAR